MSSVLKEFRAVNTLPKVPGDFNLTDSEQNLGINFVFQKFMIKDLFIDTLKWPD